MEPAPDLLAQTRIWAQIDRQLVSLKAGQAEPEFTDRYTKRLRVGPRGNAWGALVAKESVYIEWANEWTKKMFEIYTEVWQKQGKAKTPDFVGAVLNRGLLPAIGARVGAAEFEITNLATRTRSSASLEALLHKLALDADRLRSQWRARIEIEARELQLEQAKRPTPADGPPPFQEFPKMVYHLAYTLDDTAYKIVQKRDEQLALGPEWFEGIGDASAVFDSKPRPEQLEILSRSGNPAVAIDRFYCKLVDSAPGKEKLQIVQEYRDEHPHLAVNSEWAKPYLAHLLPAGVLQGDRSEKGERMQESGGSMTETKPPSGMTRNRKRTKKADLSRFLDAANLTDRQYECSSLKWEYGLTVSEIARELGLHRKTVDQHIESAQARMRSAGLYEKVRKRLSQARPGE